MATGRVPTTANSPLTAKGDLFGYSTTQARVPVGNDGETLVADSSATTGLRWQGNFAAGKNKIINGDFGIWQRGTSFTNPNGIYTVDRFITSVSGGSAGTVSRQTFTAGTAPVAGYESQYFLRYANNAGASYTDINQPIEDVRTFAGQTLTFSFWAKATSSVTFTPLFRQNFGSGGSANVDTTATPQTISSSSWTRYSVTLTLPSISGKTLGANNCLQVYLYTTGGTIASNTIDFWGWQVEAGNTATAFQTATGTLAGELAACQRYYYRTTSTDAYNPLGNGVGRSTTAARILWNLPVPMRITPVTLETSGTSTFLLSDGLNDFVVTGATTLQRSGPLTVWLDCPTSGITQFRPYVLLYNGSSSSYLGISAEL